MSLKPPVDSPPLGGLEYAQQLRDRIVKLIDDTLLQRNNRVVGNRDPFRAHVCAALRDVAVADPVCVLQVARSIFGVERIHFQSRRIHQMTRADEAVEHAMLAQDMTDILAQEADRKSTRLNSSHDQI